MTGHLDETGQAPSDHRSARTVAVLPASARAAHAELLQALEPAFRVRFTGSDPAAVAAAVAAIVFPGGRPPERLSIPSLVLTEPHGGADRGSGFAVRLSDSPLLERALRGQKLVERHTPPPAPVAADGAAVLATVDGRPVWVSRRSAGVEQVTASAMPAELGDRDFLRDHFTAGRFWSLLPLVQFLIDLSPGEGRGAQPPRACFVIDDPNLRLRSYGYVRFGELARDAREHGYHVAVATIPLDLVLPGSRALPLFRALPSHLSLAVHGNDHVRLELARPRCAREADRLVQTALARVERFERRAGIRIDRVMCPPHGGCNAVTLAALYRCGFDALTASRPFPWDGFADQRRWRLGGWLPAQLFGGGIPVIPRHPLTGHLDDLVLRALLGIPLVVYLHHGDLAGGLDPLRRAAERIGSLGDVEWTSLAGIARRNAHCHEDDGVAMVAVYSRAFRVPRPAAARIGVELPRIYAPEGDPVLEVNGVRHALVPRPEGTVAAMLANPPPGDEFRIRVHSAQPTQAAAVCRRPGAWPVARRAMTETRDRSLPWVRWAR